MAEKPKKKESSGEEIMADETKSILPTTNASTPMPDVKPPKEPEKSESKDDKKED